MSEKEVSVTGVSKSPVSVWRKHQALTCCGFLVLALIIAKETVLHEEFYEPVIMPDFMMSGNSFTKREQYFKPYQDQFSIMLTCQIMKSFY